MRILLAIALFFPVALFAATPFSGLRLSTSPEVPRPGGQVTITAVSVDRDVNALEFIWSVDGKKVADAVGQTTLTISTPPVGASAEVTVETLLNGRPYANESVFIQPAALYIESDAKSSVPPFYIGKRLPSPQGSVTLSAVPDFVLQNGTRLTPSDLFFEWRVNNVQKIKPTLGKSSAVFPIPFFNRPFAVSVTAYTRDGSLRAQESTLVVPASPSIVIYETSPLGGILDQHAVTDSYTLPAEEVTLAAYPLFTVNRADIVFKWLLNGSQVELPAGDTHTVTFRKTAAGTGSYGVESTFSHPTRFLERASRSFLLQF